MAAPGGVRLLSVVSAAAHAAAGAQQQKRLGLKSVQEIVAITSAKGGVGKSTTAVNVAVALATALKLRVGLLDADIHGPSVPQLMNLRGRPALADGAGKQPLMLPKENYRVKCMSFGFFLEGDQPAVWRGPMTNSAFDKMLFGTEWGELDVLVVDMPPGTGDAQINLGQRIPLSGAVLVSTPQDVALNDVRRGAQMFLKLRVPILGMIENMSYYECRNCGHKEHVFGRGGVGRLAQEYGLDVLGQMPLDVTIQETSDAGVPITAKDPRGSHARAYAGIAERVWAALQQRRNDAAAVTPKIVVE